MGQAAVWATQMLWPLLAQASRNVLPVLVSSSDPLLSGLQDTPMQLLDSSMPHSLEWSRDLVILCQWAT